jgi:outer membrane protein assembly factor BamE (lipoprotein component of BamABCDE complex)
MKMRMIVLPVLLALLFGCSKLTVDNYAKLKVGIEYSEVVRILGKPDSCSEALFVKNCVWGNEQKNITVNFLGDKVMLSTSRNIK